MSTTDHKRKFAELGLDFGDPEKKGSKFHRSKRYKHEEPEPPSPEPDERDEDMDDILQLIDDAPEIQPIDAGQLQAMVSKFDKAIKKNKQMRMKYAEAPDKFMASEVEVDEALATLQQLATAPELFEEFIKQNGCALLMELLVHENTDLVTTTIDLIKELIEAISETAGETGSVDESAAELADKLVDDKAIQLVFQNLERLDSSSEEDKEATHHVFAILEGLASVDPDLCAPTAKQCNLFKHLLRRIKNTKKLNEIKMYQSEILAIYVQMGGPEACEMFASVDGIQKCLIILKPFYDPAKKKGKKWNIPSAEEIEFISNLMGAVQSCLSIKAGRAILMKEKPIDTLKTLLEIVKNKSYLQSGALKCLDVGLSRQPENCSRFLQLGGLKTLFAAFMRGKVKKRFKQEQDSLEEHIISIISNLFLHLAGVDYSRLLRKFRENEFEKIDRLIELHAKYSNKVEASDERARQDTLGEEMNTYERRLGNGLFTLQLVDLVVGFVSTAGDDIMRERVAQLLNQQDYDMDDIRKVLRDYRMNAGQDQEGELPLQQILVNVIKGLS